MKTAILVNLVRKAPVLVATNPWLAVAAAAAVAGYAIYETEKENKPA